MYVSLTVSLVPLEWLPPRVKCAVDWLTFLLKVMLSVLYFCATTAVRMRGLGVNSAEVMVPLKNSLVKLKNMAVVSRGTV